MEKSKSVTKQPGKLVAAVLALSLLLSLFGGGFASAATHTVTTDAEPVYEPLAPAESVAYEEHEDGYAVSLTRAADSVTMALTAVPGSESGRAAEKARLFIRTGVALKAGVAYQVRFSLSAENAQPEYAVSFDGGSAKGAYGQLDGRSIEAECTDQVEYLITPRQQSGELVLRLQLGKTGAAGNTFRFSDLAVNEISGGKSELGESVPLVDSIDYNVGAISLWANTGSRAEVSTTGNSATLTVLEKPAAGAAVWEIQMKVATGVKPEPGKSYRVSAVLTTTMPQVYEICFNEGDIEKGYDALYGQYLAEGTSKFSHRLIIPAEKENYGELVVQFSVGNLDVGQTFTVSEVNVEEIFPQYINALSHDFKYDETWSGEKKEQTITGETPLETDINWSGEPSIIAGGDFSGGVTMDGGSAALKVNAGSREVYDAYLRIDTGETLKGGTAYKVSYKLDTERAYPESAEILCGSGQGGDRDYDALFSYTLNAGVNTVSHYFVPETSGGLEIKLQLGKTGGAVNTVKMSDLTLEEVSFSSTDIASVAYPNAGEPGSFRFRDSSDDSDNYYGGEISGSGSFARVTGIGPSGDAWRRGLWATDVCNLSAGAFYEVRLSVTASRDMDYEIQFKDDDEIWRDGALGKLYGNTGGTTNIVHLIRAKSDSMLSLRVDVGNAGDGDTFMVRDIHVYKLASEIDKKKNLSQVTYDDIEEETTSSAFFDVRDAGTTKGKITGDGESVIMTRGTDGEGWQNGLYIGFDNIGFCDLKAGQYYEVSFDIQVIEGIEGTWFKAVYSKDQRGQSGEGVFGSEEGNTSKTTQTIKHTIFPAPDDSKLIMFLELGKNTEDGAASKIRISNIRVNKISVSSDYISTDLASVRYPVGEPGSAGSFNARDEKGVISGDGKSGTFTCPAQEAEPAPYQRGMFTGTVANLEAGKSYQVSFTVTSTLRAPFEILYNKDDDWSGEKAYGIKWGLTASSIPTTVVHYVTADTDSALKMRLDLGLAPRDTQVTISDIHVVEVIADGSTKKSYDSFSNSAVWATAEPGFEARLARNTNSVSLAVSKSSFVRQLETWKTKLVIDTGVPYQPGKGYRVSFDIYSGLGVDDFCAIYNTPDETYRGKFVEKLSANETKTVVSDGLPAGTGNVQVTIELGKFNGLANSFTVSNVQVEEVDLNVFVGEKDDGTVNFDTSGPYKAEIIREERSVSLDIADVPAEGAEVWKLKLFVLTGVTVSKGEAYRVSFDLLSEKDLDFEACYNHDADEKDYGAAYNLHAEGGQVTTVEKSFSAIKDGALNLQVSLGLTKPDNKITVNNLKVERIVYNSATNVMPAALDYRVPGAVSYWSHEDYTTEFTGSDNAVTAKITQAPQLGAEPWKIKLFLDTGVVPEAGKNYKVTALVSAKAAQAYEICYNNGGVEMGYDSMGGLQVRSGKAQTVERIVSVPADKTDLNNLMLQFNLGKTTMPNEVTVSGVTVEEVPVSYTEMMPKGFAYTGGASEVWTYPDYTASLEAADDAATVHITAVSEDAAVWKVKLFVNTGVFLSPGRTYLVSADLLGAKGQKYEVCYNNEETEKGYDAIYDQSLEAGSKKTVEHNISVPASMTDAGELVLQFAVGGSVANDITVSNVSVQEISFGADSGGASAPGTVVGMYNAPGTAAGTLEVSREKLNYTMSRISPVSGDNAITVAGAGLRANDRYTVTFTARADKDMTAVFALRQADGGTAAISEQFALTTAEKEYSFTTAAALTEGGYYDLVWQFGSGDNQKLGGARAEISNISVSCPSETLSVARSGQKVTVNGDEVAAEIYSIDGYNYFKLRDLAVLLNDTDAQFVVRYNPNTNATSLTTGKVYTPVGGELELGADQSASCARNSQDIYVDGETVSLKAFNIGGNNYFRLRDLSGLLGFTVEYLAESDTVAISSPLTPEAQENGHAYDLFFLPGVDGEAQPHVGDTMPYYEDGVYYIYYLKEGGDAYNHSVYLATTTDFVTYTEYDDPVLSASRADVQDSWIGTGSVVKVEGTYYFFYTGFNSSGSQEYHEKIMVAKSSSPAAAFEKVSGWEITPPDELGQKNDFRDPQAYYDPETGTISLTITASQGGTARILKYTLDKDLKNAQYDGIIFTDPTGRYWNLECSDTFRLGDTWYLTYSGQDDTLWYAMADSRFGPYSNAERLDGKLFYAAKHVEDGTNAYMVGWARRSESASSTDAVNGWAGNLVVQQLRQQEDGRLVLVPVDGIVSEFAAQEELLLGASEATLTAGEEYSCKAAFTSSESFLLGGAFSYSGEGSFGLAFDFNGDEEQYKLISIDPAANKLSLSFNGGATPVAETQIALQPNQNYSFTYIQDGSVGIFYLDGQASLVVRLYGVTDKPVCLFAENNTVTFSSLRQCAR